MRHKKEIHKLGIYDVKRGVGGGRNKMKRGNDSKKLNFVTL
jgi:hypothetical protein